MKVKDIISTINNELNNISLDDRKSNRFIFSKYLQYESLFIKRETDSRRIFNNTQLFTVDSCFKLKEIPAVECNIYIPNCKTVGRSLEELPNFHSSIYGNMLIVTTLDDSNRFEMTTSENYKNIMSREFPPKNGYYWIIDNHLIVPKDIEAVKIKYLKRNVLTEGIDVELTTPDWMIGEIIKYVIQDIRNTKSIPSDEDPNMNNNIK